MNNADYWARRFKIMEDALKDQSYGYAKNLEQQFDAVIAQIDTQMRAWYQRFADNNGVISYAQAQKLLTAGELKEFKWTVQQYIKAGKEHAISGVWAKELENAYARVHISRLESLKIQLRQLAEVLTQARIKVTTDASELSYIQSYYHTAFEVQRGLGVGWTMQALNTGTVQKVLSRPWTVDNQTFTARCWTDKIKLVEIVNQELTRMLATGEEPDKAIAAISKRFNVSKQNAGRVVMTESAYFSSAAQKDCFNELGVEKYRIIGTLDTKTCNICGNMDGKVFKMSDYSPGSTAPPFHPWCRCCTAPYFEDMQGIGEGFARDKDGNTYTVSKDMTYEEWKQKLLQNIVEKSENSGIIKEKLSEDEEAAIKFYVSAKSYNINAKLRDGITLDAMEQMMSDNLDSALLKMPKYEGVVYRSLSSDMMSHPKSFWKEHSVGSIVSYNAFTSTSTFIYDETMDIQMIIKSKNGKDIRKYNSREGEILFNRNSAFRVTKIKNNIIYLEEM